MARVVGVDGSEDPTLVYKYERAGGRRRRDQQMDAKKMGEGSMKLTASEAGKLVKFDLSFDHGKYCPRARSLSRQRAMARRSLGHGRQREPQSDGSVLQPDDGSMVGGDFDEGCKTSRRRRKESSTRSSRISSAWTNESPYACG